MSALLPTEFTPTMTSFNARRIVGMKYLSLILCLVVILSIGGVFATWKYAELSPAEKDQSIDMSLSVFDYPPEQILPGGDTEQATPGENHNKLIDLILNEAEKGYGLNEGSNTLLHSLLREDKYVYSNQKTTGGNLKFIIDPKNAFNTFGLYYCLEKVSDTLYYCYTFDINALSTASGTSDYITVYRTSLVKTDNWRAPVSYEGVAQTVKLSDLGISADSQSLKYSIDMASWRLPFDQ